jgi:hypothetical protein
VSLHILVMTGIVGARHQSDAGEHRQHLFEKLQPPTRQIGKDRGQPGRVSAGPREARDEPRPSGMASRALTARHGVQRSTVDAAAKYDIAFKALASSGGR